MNIYDEKAWKRLVATAGAVTMTAHSTYVDNRPSNSTAAFTALSAATAGARIVFIAYEPPKNRWHILRATSS